MTVQNVSVHTTTRKPCNRPSNWSNYSKKLDRIMTGELDEIVDALLLADQANKLEELND